MIRCEHCGGLIWFRKNSRKVFVDGKLELTVCLPCAFTIANTAATMRKAVIDDLEEECEMLAELMPDCPVSYGGSVWCRRLCPVFGRHDDEENYYCTTAERREFARKEIERDKEYRVRNERVGETDTHTGEGN